jgi:hypothetical protein
MRLSNHSNQFQMGRTSPLPSVLESRKGKQVLFWVLLAVWLRLRVWWMVLRTSRKRSMHQMLGSRLHSEVARRPDKNDAAAGRCALFGFFGVIGVCGVY